VQASPDASIKSAGTHEAGTPIVARAGHVTDWDSARWAGALRGRTVLIVTADDQSRADMERLAAALRKNGFTALRQAPV
jgi:hypothetical protein